MTAKPTSPTTIDEYIAGFPPNVQKLLRRIRKTIRMAAPGAKEAIKYRIPTFVLSENLVHFAAFESHIGFYPTPSGIAEFCEELSSFRQGKGSVQFPLNEPLPLELVERIVQFRVTEVHENQLRRSRC